MAVHRNPSISADELTGDGSFDGDWAHLRPQASEQHCWRYRLLRLLQRLPWVHILVPGLIVAAALSVSRFALPESHAERETASSAGSLFEANVSTLIVGFGFAIYGCIINRRLQKQIQRHEQLGSYTLHELIGSGGMGDVYLAEHQLLKRKCAVKLIRRDRASNRRMLARFEREVKATAQLTHWNTVQVYDYGCTPGGTFYYAMEYLQGLNLRQLVDDHGPLPPGRVVFILRQLCGALHEAAQYGLVHRDIKPSNIFLAERGQMYDVAKLLDFGLVIPASLGTSPIRNLRHQLQGSPRYMCPEQAQGLKPDCRGDLYSLACVAYFLLSGQSPFEDDNPVMLVVAHASVPAPRIEDLDIDVPRDLSDIVMKCLSKKPADRYQTPRELQDALEQCACVGDWSWSHAERWWLDHPEDNKHETCEQTSVTMDTQEVAPGSVREPEPTFLCEEHSRRVF